MSSQLDLKDKGRKDKLKETFTDSRTASQNVEGFWKENQTEKKKIMHIIHDRVKNIYIHIYTYIILYNN